MTGKNYTTAEAAKQIGVSKNTLLRWLYAKEVSEPKQMIGNNIRVWSEEEIEAARKYKAKNFRNRS